MFHRHDPPGFEGSGLKSQKKSVRASEQDRADVRQARKSWRYRLAKRNKQRLFYLDESGAQTNLTRRYGRALRGERLIAAVPAGHWSSLTMVCAISLGGVVAPMVTDGPMNHLIFQGYVDWLLVPQLRPGDTVVMDNLSCHKSPAVTQSIESTGAKLLYLPPYSPDLNPIEKLWSKIKARLRAEAKRTPQTLTKAIGKALRSITLSDCRGFFESVGITATPM
jgi:transposase